MKEVKETQYFEVDYVANHKKIVGIPRDRINEAPELLAKHCAPFWINWDRAGVVTKEGETEVTIPLGIKFRPVAINKKYKVEGEIHATVSKTVEYVVEAASEKEARDIAGEMLETDTDNAFYDNDWDYPEVDAATIDSVEAV